MKHFQLRHQVDRNAKKARCACGWAGPWRSTPPTGKRRRDAHARAVLARADYDMHQVEMMFAMTDTDIRPDVAPPMQDGDHERCAHIVYPKEAIMEAAVTGTPVIALCGKVWVPNRDPERFPVCTGCIEEFEKITQRPWPGRR